MSTKSFALPNVFGFSAPVVRSEHKGHSASSVSSAASRRPAIVSGRNSTSSAGRTGARSLSLRRARSSVRAMGASPALRNWLGLSLAVGVGVLSIAYVIGVNSYAATGYIIQKEQVNLAQLQDDNKKLLVKTAEVGSISQIQDEATARNLVAITSEEFLHPNQLSQR